MTIENLISNKDIKQPKKIAIIHEYENMWAWLYKGTITKIDNDLLNIEIEKGEKYDLKYSDYVLIFV